MKLRERKKRLPAIIVIPMIDIMFFLLVFFILATMHMTNVKTVPVKLSDMRGGMVTDDVAFAVTIDSDNHYFVGNTNIDLGVLKQYAQKEVQKNANAFIVVRTDANSSYQAFANLIDALKSVGVARFGIATDTGE